MAVMIIPPPQGIGTQEEQLKSLYSYLYRLSEHLNVALAETEEKARETAYKALGVPTDKTTGKVPADAQNAYQQLKALIVKTANNVSANYRKLVTEMTADYRAQSDYGTYEEYLKHRIEADASGAIAEWDRVNGITEGMDYIANSSGYIKVGLVKEYPDGTADVGVVVGQDLRSVTIDGKEIVTSQNLYSLWTADSLSFWRNGTELTRIGLEDFFVERAYISETTTNLLQSPTFGVQLVMRDDVLKAIAGSIDLSANSSIKLSVSNAVGSVQVGGTNLLKDSKGLSVGTTANDWRLSNTGASRYEWETGFSRIQLTKSGATSDTWIGASSPVVRLPDDWKGKQVTVSANLSSPNWKTMEAGTQPPIAWIVCLSKGEATRLNYGGRYNIIAVGGTGFGKDAVCDKPLVNTDWLRVSTTFMLDETDISSGDGVFDDNTHIFVQFFLRRNGDYRISAPKLEFGNKATDWSPNPEEFRAGSAITLTEDEVQISTPKFNVNIVSEDGETNMLSIDEEGANMPKLIASNVAVRYDGPSQLYVNPSATAAQIEAGNYFRSLADALSMLNQKHVDRYVDIRLAAGMTEYGSLTMAAISGGQWISIVGDSASPAKLVGGLTVSYCISPISIKYLNVDTQSIGIGVAGCSWVTIDSCVITGPGTGVTGSRCVYTYNGGVVSVSNCELYDCQYSMQGDRAGSVTGSANKGNCRVGANRCCVHLENSQPCDSTTWTVTEWAGKVYTASVSVNQGSKPTPIPAPTSASVTANLTDSWYSSSKAWIRSDNYMRQGYTGSNGEWSGCMWFATSAFSGKTIKSAALTIKRDNGYGRSGEVTLKLWGITTTTNSGNPNTNAVSYGALGTIENGETKTFTLPVAAAQALASGTIKGFMLRSDDGGVMSGRTYSYNYCRISTMPVLAVTFT